MNESMNFKQETLPSNQLVCRHGYHLVRKMGVVVVVVVSNKVVIPPSLRGDTLFDPLLEEADPLDQLVDHLLLQSHLLLDPVHALSEVLDQGGQLWFHRVNLVLCHPCSGHKVNGKCHVPLLQRAGELPRSASSHFSFDSTGALKGRKNLSMTYFDKFHWSHMTEHSPPM